MILKSYKVLFLLFWSFAHVVTGQSLAVPMGTFVSPVDYVYKLSGGFSELRETHFHSGIDIKPSYKGKKDRIYSIASGHVSRIKVSPSGYGNAVYIDHPELGFTSVYGHLESFSLPISAIVKLNQIKNASFDIDISLTKEILPITCGEVIGIMGNSGSSFGEHLHLEIRDTKTERPINPALFGFTVADNISPSVVGLAIHGLDDYFHKLCDIRIPMATAENNLLQILDVIDVPAKKVGFALQVYDKANGSNNKLGIYTLRVFADENMIYSYHMDKISFAQSRQITGFYDYAERKKTGNTYSLLYKLPGIDLDFLLKNDLGIITLSSDKNTKMRIEVEDYARNKKTLIFEVKQSHIINEKVNYGQFTKWVNVGQEEEIKQPGIIVSFGKNDLYRSIPFLLERTPNSKGNSHYKIHHEQEALKSNIQIMIKPDVIYPALQSKAIVVWVSGKGKNYNCGGVWQENYLKCRVGEFGYFTIQYDTIAPTIKPKYFKPIAKNINKFKFEIRDNYPVKGRDAKDIQYTVRIDNNLIICPYDQKSSSLEVPIQNLSYGKHAILITLKDHSGNIREYKNTFVK